MLTSFRSTDTVFNQYRDCNEDLDLPDATSIRRANLRAYMEKACKRATILVVGEAAGPWGCRFSGVPFTGERQLLDPSFPFRGDRSSRTDPRLPTNGDGPPFISDSAKTFWQVMLPYHRRFVAWDALPLHPHKRNDVLSIGKPTKPEVCQFGEALRLIRAYVEPRRIIGLGRKAEQALKRLGEACVYVRHPSHGGQTKFTAGMQRLFADCIQPPASTGKATRRCTS